MAQQPSLSAIRRYYEQNTRLFLRFGSSQQAQSIHRSVWTEGVRSKAAALNHSNELVRGEIERLARERGLERLCIADLGCGVGGSLFYILPRLAVQTIAVGATLSPTQARLAHQWARSLDLPHPCSFVEADFQALPLAAGFDAAYSIEAFAHSVQPDCYFEGAARLLKPGGRLALCDDFLAEPVAGGGLGAVERLWLEAYQAGWHIPGLVTLSGVVDLASAHGLHLVRQRNLTPHLRLRALPGLLARMVLALGSRIPVRHAFLASMLGSLALQQCLKLSVIQYHFLVFDKPG
jgi:SAM-dependent methyltransferase